jgi:hypothetical protein
MIEVVRVARDPSRQADPLALHLGHEGCASRTGGRASRSLVPDRLSKRLLARKRRAKSQRRLGEGSQA